jgi:hypothetical protein
MKGLVQRVSLRSLTFSHFDWKDTSPPHAHAEGDGNTISYILHRVGLCIFLKVYFVDYQSFKRYYSRFQAMIYGNLYPSWNLFRHICQRPTLLSVELYLKVELRSFAALCNLRHGLTSTFCTASYHIPSNFA